MWSPPQADAGKYSAPGGDHSFFPGKHGVGRSVRQKIH